MQLLVTQRIAGPLAADGSTGVDLDAAVTRVLVQVSGSVSSVSPPGLVGVRLLLDGAPAQSENLPPEGAAATVFDSNKAGREVLVPLSVVLDLEADKPQRLALVPLNPNTRTSRQDRFVLTVFDLSDGDLNEDATDAPKTTAGKAASRSKGKKQGGNSADAPKDASSGRSTSRRRPTRKI